MRKAKVHLKDIKVNEELFQIRDFSANGVRATLQHRASRDLIKSLTSTLKQLQDDGGKVELDPITLWKDPEGQHWIIDGHHRHAAYLRAEVMARIPAHIHDDIDQNAARRLAWSENHKAKLNMTQAECSQAAWSFIRSSDPHFQETSVRKLAAYFGGQVGKSAVSRMRSARSKIEQEGLLDDPEFHDWRAVCNFLRTTDSPYSETDVAREKQIEVLSSELAALLKKRYADDWTIINEAFGHAMEEVYQVNAEIRVDHNDTESLEEDPLADF